MWPDTRLLELLRIEHPIVQAPMIGPTTLDLAVAVAEAGGLASFAAAAMSAETLRHEVGSFRRRTTKPINLNFFCHTPPRLDPAREARWRTRLAPYYAELGLDSKAELAPTNRSPFDAVMCAAVEELRPEIVSFHFGLPDPVLLDRVKGAGCVVLGCATTVAEARWLTERRVDAIVAQGAEAGGHRGIFLTDDLATQPGLFALLPQIVDAVSVPVIGAGGIADARGIVAALALGAAGVQIGTGYLLAREAKTPPPHRAAVRNAAAESTAMTNVFTGRPARGILNRLMREVGPMSPDAPEFPLAAGSVQPLRATAEAAGSGDFSPLWSGQAAALTREGGAGELTRGLAEGAQALLRRLAG